MGQIIEINTDRMIQPKIQSNLFTNRALFAEMQRGKVPEVSIIVVGYNRVDKTKRCVESILEYTKGIDYELVLVDSGSEDGTLEYYDSVSYHKKKVIHITKNLGAAFAYSSLSLNDLGRFICIVQNDLIVTPHWLDNLLACIKSDMRIGMVNPMSSNVSNRQCVEFSYESYEEMQEKAKQFNRPDRRKWEDRLRLVTLGTLYRKEVFLAAGWPIGDMGFFHDFFDDDVSFTIRRLGYRLVLAGDTWICHDHDFQGGEDKDLAQYHRSLQNGRVNFYEKYYGVDAWGDVDNSYIRYLDYIPLVQTNDHIRILGIDVKCGTPILDVKNHLRKVELFHAELSAFTQDPKYWLDLKTICEGTVICDREEFLADAFPAETFDYVIADYSFNCCRDPQKTLEALFTFCKEGGIVITRFKNSFPYQENSHLVEQQNTYGWEFFYQIFYQASHETARMSLETMGTVRSILSIPSPLDEKQSKILENIIPAELSADLREEILNRISCEEYLLVVQKKEAKIHE